MTTDTSIGGDADDNDVSPLGDGTDRDRAEGPSVESDEAGRDVRREDIETGNDRNTSADQNNRSPKSNRLPDQGIEIQ